MEQHLNDEGIRNLINQKDGIEYAEVEEVTVTSFSSMANSSLADNFFKDTQKAVAKIDTTKKVLEVNETLKEVVSDLNNTYGLNVNVDFDNFARMLKEIIDPNRKRVMELYTSEIFGRFRVIQYLKLIQATALMMDTILDPKELLNPKLSYSDRFAVVKQLFEFMKELEAVYAEIKINSSDLELKNLNSDTGAANTDPKLSG